MSYSRKSIGPIVVGKMLLNSLKRLLLAIFMLTLTYTTFSLGYPGAAAFFGLITLVLGVIIYQKLSNELVRAKYGEYKVDM